MNGGTATSKYLAGDGVVFKIAPDGTESVLYAFKGPAKGDGANPYGNLITDNAGNLYGTTLSGGIGCGPEGCGTVFKIAKDGTETVLHAFAGGASDGSAPYDGLMLDKAGNLYGTTSEGGSNSACNVGTPGCGTVFKLTPDGTETVLYAFCVNEPCYDGAYPYGGLIADNAGNLYGTTTTYGHPKYNGEGAVFKLARDGTETVLYSFGSAINASDGEDPVAGVVADKAGNLYGTTISGGSKQGLGVVFKLAPQGTETVLHAFRGTKNGYLPWAGVLIENGHLFGASAYGDVKTHCGTPTGRCGAIFMLDK
jgi:uncharacterized repeat protein (TIGR03803 family)